MIKVEKIDKAFKLKNNSVRILSNISFEIKRGEAFGIVGKSGAGKSTLLRILSLQTPFSVGTYHFLNQNVSDLKKSKQRLLIKETGFVFQGFNLLYHKSVLENVALPLRLSGANKKERLLRAKEMLSFVGLAKKANNYPITLSGGEAQRVAIARALINRPKILFCDEPTSSLDEQTAVDILKLLKHVHETFKLTLVIVSHQVHIIQAICDRALLLEDGQMKHIGPVKKSDAALTQDFNRLWGDAYV